MIRRIYIVLLLLSSSVFAQFEEISNVESDDKYSKEAPSEIEMTNKGVFINTSVGAGLGLRRTNGSSIKNKNALSIPLTLLAEVGISRNFRAGLVIERNGNGVSTDDSLRIYSLNYGGNFFYRFANTERSFFYVRGSIGWSDLQVSSANFQYGNINDSTVVTSDGGFFLNLAVGREIGLQKGLNIFYQVKFGTLYFPEMISINFITLEKEKMNSDSPNVPLKLSYKQIFFEVGLSFKI